MTFEIRNDIGRSGNDRYAENRSDRGSYHLGIVQFDGIFSGKNKIELKCHGRTKKRPGVTRIGDSVQKQYSFI